MMLQVTVLRLVPVGGLIGLLSSKFITVTKTSAANVVANYKTGLIFTVDNEDNSRFLLLAFSGRQGVSYCYNMLTNNILTLGATNSYGSININGGSGSYEYNIIAFKS